MPEDSNAEVKNKPTPLSLSDLNQNFGLPGRSSKDIDQKPAKRWFQLHKKHTIMGIAVLAICILAGVGMTVYRTAMAQRTLETYQVLSQEKEYEEQYKKVLSNERYVGVNQSIMVQDDKAQVGLVNAVGNDSMVAIRIYDNDSGKVHYQSEPIRPGSILHIAVLEGALEKVENLALDYTIYDMEGKEQGCFTVNAQFLKVD